MTRLMIAAGLAAAALAVAGCGGDDNDNEGASAPATTGTSSTPQSAARKEKVELVDFKIKPADATVKAGATEFDVVNTGQAPHALEIEANGEEFKTDVLEPGQQAKLNVNLKDGKYEWYCPVDGHRQQGMEGTLTVGGGGGSASSGNSSGGGGY